MRLPVRGVRGVRVQRRWSWGGEPAAVREAPGSHSKLQAEGTDKAAGHSSGQMKAVKLTGGTQASHPDGSLELGGGGWWWGTCARA